MSLEILDGLIITPVKEVILDLFKLETRQAIAYITIAYIVAFFLYLHRKRKPQKNTEKYSSFWNFIGGNKVYFHKSAIIDYQFYFMRVIFGNLILLPIFAFLIAPEFISGEIWGQWWQALLGPNEGVIEKTTTTTIIYALVLFIVGDFSHYWVHRIFHSGLLWEFHKVHHSAEVLVPQTANRVHTVETLAERLSYITLSTPFTGLFIYLYGEPISGYTILGALYTYMIFNAIASNLRHSHVWLSFGPFWEHFINSPAQHHIHHSTNPAHFNKNFGTNLSIWDWMFGTLHITSPDEEELEFGLAPEENANYDNVIELFYKPFIMFYKAVRDRFTSKGTAKISNEQKEQTTSASEELHP